MMSRSKIYVVILSGAVLIGASACGGGGDDPPDSRPLPGSSSAGTPTGVPSEIQEGEGPGGSGNAQLPQPTQAPPSSDDSINIDGVNPEVPQDFEPTEIPTGVDTDNPAPQYPAPTE